MDVLSELLNSAGANMNFKFQNNIKASKLNHLCFADDLLLFCKGDKDSIMLMMQSVNTFEAFSGLKINACKSTFFASNTSPELKAWINQEYGIQLGNLPTKFLGVPLLATGLHASHCQPLISKITARIESWVMKFLSFAGRLQLITSVLFSIQNYWSAHFLLPVAVLKLLQRKIAHFLWNGHDSRRTKAKVSWKSVTLPKSEGGLGIKDLRDWNKAFILKHLIAVVNPCSTSLWASWVKKTIIKGSLWSMQCPYNASWIIKQIFLLRDIALQHISYSIGNGRDVSLWFAPWFNRQPICSSFDNQLISLCGLGKEAVVADIISPGGWMLPHSNFHELVIWKNQFDFSTHFDLAQRDKICWDNICGSKIRVTHLWDSIRRRGNNTIWAPFVWHKLGVPRFSFHHWLLMLNRVSTADKLVNRGVTSSDACFFYINGTESNHHLFLECPFTQRIIQLVFSHRCAMPPDLWSLWYTWLTSMNLKDIKDCISILAYQVIIYSVWRERNSRFFSEEYSSPAKLASNCLHLIKCRLHSSTWFAVESLRTTSLSVWSLDN
ncbi:hypothetical protein ACET3Z_009883 [Daucus carota]